MRSLVLIGSAAALFNRAPIAKFASDSQLSGVDPFATETDAGSKAPVTEELPAREGNTYGSKDDACNACYQTISKSCASYLGYTCSAANSAVIGQDKVDKDAGKGADAVGKIQKGQLGQTDFNDWYFSVNAEGAGSAYQPCCNAPTQDTSYKSSVCTTYDPNGDAEADDAANWDSPNHHAFCTKKLAAYPAVEPAK